MQFEDMVPNRCMTYINNKFLHNSNYLIIHSFFWFLFFFFFQAVLEKQSYMLIGRHDIEKLMRCDPASACLPNPFGQPNMESNASDVDVEVEMELCDLLLSLRPIKQVLCLEDIILFLFLFFFCFVFLFLFFFSSLMEDLFP